eukprot:6874162-Prymnesium_polylepis.1
MSDRNVSCWRRRTVLPPPGATPSAVRRHEVQALQLLSEAWCDERHAHTMICPLTPSLCKSGYTKEA